MRVSDLSSSACQGVCLFDGEQMSFFCFCSFCAYCMYCRWHVSSELALQAGLAYAPKINEKGRIIPFPYQSIQSARMPITAPNLQILTCGCQNDRLTCLFGVFSASSCCFWHACTLARPNARTPIFYTLQKAFRITCQMCMCASTLFLVASIPAGVSRTKKNLLQRNLGGGRSPEMQQAQVLVNRVLSTTIAVTRGALFITLELFLALIFLLASAASKPRLSKYIGLVVLTSEGSKVVV